MVVVMVDIYLGNMVIIKELVRKLVVLHIVIRWTASVCVLMVIRARYTKTSMAHTLASASRVTLSGTRKLRQETASRWSAPPTRFHGLTVTVRVVITDLWCLMVDGMWGRVLLVLREW